MLKIGDKVRVTELNGSKRRFKVLDARFVNTSMGWEYKLSVIGWTNHSWCEKVD